MSQKRYSIAGHFLFLMKWSFMLARTIQFLGANFFLSLAMMLWVIIFSSFYSLKNIKIRSNNLFFFFCGNNFPFLFSNIRFSRLSGCLSIAKARSADLTGFSSKLNHNHSNYISINMPDIQYQAKQMRKKWYKQRGSGERYFDWACKKLCETSLNKMKLRDGCRYQNGWIFGKVPKGGSNFQSKNLCCRFWELETGLFEHEIDTKE